ncbi:MAG TPA: helix-hairpin-helix domain-containing protein [Terriglobales bacterium]|nr:helix-hairpin-helix domain-containing protein [Terriglobales bacterium]
MGNTQRQKLSSHLSAVRIYILVVSFFSLLLLAACTSPSQNPDQLREQTAKATAELKSDTKAIAEGVKEGLQRDKTLDLNRATKDQLTNLPGITNERADRIIAGRPYENSQELVTRHIVSQQEYDRIRDQVSAKK